MIPRIIDIAKLLQPERVLVIYGPRRVGKTTLLRSFLQRTKLRYKLETGEHIDIQELLSSQDFKRILPFAEGSELIAIDEAQHIPNVGMGLKILVDHVPSLIVIATGSSSFDLSQQIGEPLTGRKRTVILFPFSQEELLARYNRYDLQQNLEKFLIYGSYPEVITATTNHKKMEILQEIVQSYLLKDILSLDRIRSPRPLNDLLKLLAFQIGNEVSLNEIATQIQLDVKTVGRYLDLLEKIFVIKRVGGFSRNLRNEVTAKAKYYFYDTGIRNGLIMQFQNIKNRDDMGALFENFIMIERLKFRSYHQQYGDGYFWRTYQSREIDLIEERDGKLHAFEIKLSPMKKATAPPEWRKAYPDATFQVINRENYLDFVLPKKRPGATTK